MASLPVEALLLRVVLPPALIGLASLAGRRWGQAVSGWLVGLPLTSGPIAFILAREQGATFGAATAAGSLGGAVAEAAFCLAYGHVALRAGWPLALAVASAAFAAVGAGLQRADLPLTALALAAVTSLALGLYLLPTAPRGATAGPLPRWDLPARMAITTAVVVVLTQVAPVLGPGPSGAGLRRRHDGLAGDPGGVPGARAPRSAMQGSGGRGILSGTLTGSGGRASMPRVGVYDQIKAAFQDIVAPEIRELRADIHRLDQRIDMLDQKVDMKVEGLRSEIGGLRAELMAEIRRLDARFDAVDLRFDAVDARFEGLEARFDAVDARFNGVDTRIDAATRRIDGLEHEVRTAIEIRERLAALEARRSP